MDVKSREFLDQLGSYQLQEKPCAIKLLVGMFGVLY
jgi:hypothetical protein